MNNTKPHSPFRESARRLLLSTSTFWHHFTPMCIILAMALAVQLTSSSAYTRQLRANDTRQMKQSLTQSCQTLTDTLYRLYSVPKVMETSTSYKNLEAAVENQAGPATLDLFLTELQTDFSSAYSLAGLPQSSAYFLYYPELDCGFVGSRILLTSQPLFSSFLTMEELTAEAVREEVSAVKSQLNLRPAIWNNEPCLLALLNSPGSKSVLGLVLPQEALMELFRLGQFPESAYCRINTPDGTLLISRSNASKNALELNATIGGNRCSVSLGIPMEYFSAQMASTRNFSILMLLLTLLVGLGVSVWFSVAGTRPLRRLLSSYDLTEQDSNSRNEIYRLSELLAASKQTSQAVSQILSIQTLSRVLSGGVLSQQEEAALLETYPILSLPCRIAIVHSTGSEELEQTEITELLQSHLPEQFVCATVNHLESGVLFPDDADALSDLAAVLEGCNQQLRLDGLSLQSGVSAPFSGVHSAYAAVRQARFSIPIRESSTIEVYSAREDGDDRPGVFSWLTHERMYQAMMNNDREGTAAFIRTLGSDRYYSAADAKEVFYNVRFVVRSTAGELRLPLPEADTLEYQEALRPRDNFRQLELLANTLFDRLHARQETSDRNALEPVIAYIEEHFRNPDLSAALVSTHFSLPLKAVYAALRKKTDLNFNDYVMELRMKEAARLLCTTQKSAEEIGAQCGYPAQSTFYRVFKKYYGESPNRYRSLHLPQKNQ